MNKNVLEHFKKNDLIMFDYFLTHPINIERPAKSSQYFFKLCQSIAYQQLSGSAASSIFSRLLTDIGQETFDEQTLLKYTPEELRTFGFSNSKCRYMLNIANASIDGIVDFKKIDYFTDEEIISQLTQIKGVGRWTAEMFLISTLGREDVFSFGDLGLKKGIEKMYVKKNMTTKSITRISNRWKPFRTYASLALWDILDNR